MQQPLITAIILTYNEEIHLQRCLSSLKKIDANVVIVDSFSTDDTIRIAANNNVKVYRNRWINYSIQFNWALENCEITTPWTLRIDADEILSDALASDINSRLAFVEQNINGVYFLRGLEFLKQPIRFGGLSNIYHLKLWRTKTAYCELTWMDEHMKLISGDSIRFKGRLIDSNLNNVHSFIDKHNDYATREAIHYFNLIYSFNGNYGVESKLFGEQDLKKKYFKNIYYKLPIFFRAFMYYIYRYFILLGFLDGAKGFIYHFLQAFWYRLLVDIKIYEVNRMAKSRPGIVSFIRDNYGYDIEKIF